MWAVGVATGGLCSVLVSVVGVATGGTCSVHVWVVGVATGGTCSVHVYLYRALAINCHATFNDKEGAESKEWKKGKPVRVVCHHYLHTCTHTHTHTHTTHTHTHM